MAQRTARPPLLLAWALQFHGQQCHRPDFLLYGDGGATGVGALLLMHVTVATAAVVAYRTVMPLS
ncbi:hypothetical protein ACUXZZ_03230 [Streptomyces graminifolii]|uniref:hypothetical protein n=1 Tax=Streptomyces TaxID=1883 RepID=UPI0036913F83